MFVYVSRSSKDSGAYDLGELDQALFLYLDGQAQAQAAASAATAEPSSGVQDQQRRKLFLHMHQNFIFLPNSDTLFLQFQKEEGNSSSLTFFICSIRRFSFGSHQNHV